MPKIEMLRLEIGAADQIHVAKFNKGEVYDVPEHLARGFCDDMSPPAAFRVGMPRPEIKDTTT